MPLDIVDLRNFYRTPLGDMTGRVLSSVIRRHLPETKGQMILGLGFAIPYLDMFRAEADRVFAAMPDIQGVLPWPSEGNSATVLASTSALPFADASIDSALVVHALETEDSPRALLGELWRILAPGGSVIVVVPNRRGLWARMDTTPFGYGEPYSRRQITDLLRDALFSPAQWTEALYFPPLERPVLLKSAPAFERIGGKLGLPFSGVHVIAATKLLYRPLLVRETVRQKARLRPVLVPYTSPRLDEIPDQGH